MTNFSRKFCAKSPFKFDKYIRGKKEEEEKKFDLSSALIIGAESEIEKIKKEKEEKEKETDRLIDGDLTEKERKQQLDKSFR